MKGKRLSHKFFYVYSFTIDNFQGERFFLVNMNLSLCFEAHGDCIRRISILENTLLPKRRCPWDVNTGTCLILV